MTSVVSQHLLASPATSTSTPSLILPPLPTYTLKPLPSLIPGIPDVWVSLALPIIAYWGVSIIFHIFDEYDLFPQYRLHTPAEILARNRVSRSAVVKTVLFQQLVQTVAGVAFAYFDSVPMYGSEEYDVAVWGTRIRRAQASIPALVGLVGIDSVGFASKFNSSHPLLAGALAGGHYSNLTQTVVDGVSGATAIVPAFASWELSFAKFIYWLLIPAFQFVLASVVIDSWQYFWHRAMHLNKWMYVKFHSHHHRLYVPYAFGALYNHPVEGFLMDTLGACIAYLSAGMTTRQTMAFFVLCVVKTVDDHCGYALPWDPLQLLSSNNAAYHDIHHQSWGIKSNFSQPFFIFWDIFMGTKWQGETKLRYENDRSAAEKKLERLVRDKAEKEKEKEASTTASDTSATLSVRSSLVVPETNVESAIAPTLSFRSPKSANSQDVWRCIPPSSVSGKENMASALRRTTKTGPSSIPDGFETLTSFTGLVRGNDW